MEELTTRAAFDAYALNPRRYIVITDSASGNHVHKVSCRHVRPMSVGNGKGKYYAVGTVREAFQEFVKLVGCFDRKCTTSWDISHLKQQAATS
jgi:hypothetical protein